MTTLDKLVVSGIRSFGPDKENMQTIKFSTPVTLFLGQNGCGKTTILESIKFALSGEIPGGTSSGQGFVNDPSLSGKSETKGQIRLKIIDVSGKETTIIKSLKLSKLKTTLKFQRLDSTIMQQMPGEESRQFSGRCADIDLACCEALKVSSCILNNVLLCHQENSAWPLEEGKKLKEKFDEIFDSTNYNKCVDILRKIVKDKKNNIKLLNTQLENKKDKKIFVERETSKLEDLKTSLEQLEINIASKNKSINPIKIRFKEICEKEEKFSLLKQNLAKKEETKKGLCETQNTIKKNITTIFEGSDDELESKIKSFETDRKNEENAIVQLEQKKVVLENKEKSLNASLQKSQIKFGQLNEEKNQYEQRCVERKNLLQKGIIQLNIAGSSSDTTSNEGAKTIIHELVAAVEASEYFFNDLLETKNSEVEILQTNIDEIKEKYISTKQNVESQKKTVMEYREKIRDINGRLGDLSCSENSIIKNNEKIEHIQEHLQTAKANLKEAEFNKKMSDYKTQIEGMEKEQEKLENEYRQVQKNSVTSEKLNSEKENVAKKKNEINKLKNKHASNLEHLFHSDLPENNLQKLVKDIQNKSEVALKNLQKKIDVKQKELTTLEGIKTHQEERLKNFGEDVKAKKNKINNLCKDKQYEDYIKETYDEKERLQRDKAICTSGKVMYERFIKNFEEKACCPVCKTNFANKQNAIIEIINSLKTQLENIPNKLIQVDTNLKKNEDLYIKLQQLKPVSDDIEIINNCNIPLLEEQLHETKNQLVVLNTELTSLKEELKIPQKNIDVCKNFVTDAAILDLHQIDIKKSIRNIEELQLQVSDVSTKTPYKLESEIDNLKIDINEIRRKCETDKVRFEKNKKLYQDLRDQHSKCIELKLKLEADAQGKPELENQVKEYIEKEKVLKSEIQEYEIKCVNLKQDLDEALKNKTQLSLSNKRIINEEQEKINKNKMIIEDIKRIQKTIDDYLNKPNQLGVVNEEIKSLENKVKDLANCKDKIISEITNKKEELGKRESNFRSLSDNVTLRLKQKEENVVNAEIEELKLKIGNDNLFSVNEEKQTLQRTYERLNNDVNKMEGEKVQLSSSIKEKTFELNHPNNKNAFKDYKNKLIELKVTENVIKDLETYTKVFENSILEYHKDKMKQINKTIRELWRNIYRGNDIDYIEIKPEESSGKAARRTYNYKVIQVKRGVEIEMRGRCSAGQKVLACLVIRMALAEIFSTSCGILALDEPTTNLDHDNIRSLIDALSTIINERQIQKSFQLLIITHDADFLDTLVRVQNVTNYYKVSRNENGFSIVTRHNL